MRWFVSHGSSLRRRIVLALALAGLLVIATTAAADSIKLKVPPSPSLLSTWPITVSGEDSQEGSEIYIGPWVEPEAPCPTTYGAAQPKFDPQPQPHAISTGHFSFIDTFPAAPPGGEDHFCAYVIHGNTTTAAEVPGFEISEAPVAEREEDLTGIEHTSVKAVEHSGHSSSQPGYTNLDLTTEPYAYVTVRLSRYGQITHHIEWGSSASGVAMVIPWTCSSPGGTYHYVVSVRLEVGGLTVKRSGHFTPVSAARCRALKRSEVEARERSAREYAERLRQEAQESREKLEQWEGNCRALGGTPVTLYTSEGTERACRGPRGGLLPVPV